MSTQTSERSPIAFEFAGKNSQTSEITSLRAAMATNQIIYKTDVNRLITLINNMAGHYHSFLDVRQQATFGAGFGDNPGAGDRTTYSRTVNTTAPSGWPGTINPLPGGPVTITAVAINASLSAVRTMNSHSHPIVDQTDNTP
jgi:hypothetical protein